MNASFGKLPRKEKKTWAFARNCGAPDLLGVERNKIQVLSCIVHNLARSVCSCIPKSEMRSQFVITKPTKFSAHAKSCVLAVLMPTSACFVFLSQLDAELNEESAVVKSSEKS